MTDVELFTLPDDFTDEEKARLNPQWEGIREDAEHAFAHLPPAQRLVLREAFITKLRENLKRGALAVGLAVGLGLGSVASAPAQTGYVDAVYAACAREGCDPQQLIRVINCETGGTWNPYSVGPNGELGLLQIDPRYWQAAYYGPFEQIAWAAKMFAAGYSHLWVCQ